MKKYVTKIVLEPKFAEGEQQETSGKKPSAFKSFLPIIFPLLLIILASVASYPSKPFGENQFSDIILFLGTPIIALLIGAFFVLYPSCKIRSPSAFFDGLDR